MTGVVTELYKRKRTTVPIFEALSLSCRSRFWMKVDRSAGESACWPWTARRNRRGYGVFTLPKSAVLANRVALSILLGRDLLPGMQACHSCDNPPCVNPSHLFEGTAADNIRDKVAKGRGSAGRGERHGKAKLSADDVRSIRKRVASGEHMPSLALEYNVARTTINDIALRVTWKLVA